MKILETMTLAIKVQSYSRALSPRSSWQSLLLGEQQTRYSLFFSKG
jgi:hypothetical protein